MRTLQTSAGLSVKPNQNCPRLSGVGTMIDWVACLQPARAPKQQTPLAPCKGRGRFPAHEEDCLCLPSGSVGSILGKAMSATDFWNTVKPTNKQTNKQIAHDFFKVIVLLLACII